MPTKFSAPNIIEYETDPQLLGLSISPAQETLLRSLYGLPLTDEQEELLDSAPAEKHTSRVTTQKPQCWPVPVLAKTAA